MEGSPGGDSDNPIVLVAFIAVVIGIAIQYRFFPGRCTVMSDVCLKKKYKLALWILAVLPLLLYCCEFTSRKEYLKIFFEYLGYGIIILFTFAFIFYRVKFKKSGIMDATYIMDAICDALFLSVTIFVLKPLLFFLHFWCFVK